MKIIEAFSSSSYLFKPRLGLAELSQILRMKMLAMLWETHARVSLIESTGTINSGKCPHVTHVRKKGFVN